MNRVIHNLQEFPPHFNFLVLFLLKILFLHFEVINFNYVKEVHIVKFSTGILSGHVDCLI